jgi:flagellar motor switch protein FliM
MEISEEDNKELQRMVTSPWTFSFPNMNAYKYNFNLRCNILFFSSNDNRLLGGQPRFLFYFQ